MRRIFVLLIGALVIAACERGRAAPTVSNFERDSERYEWRPILGSSGALVLSRLDKAGGGRPVFMILCSSPDLGGLHLRLGELEDGPIAVEAGAARFLVDARRSGPDAIPAVEGQARVPEGWFADLATAAEVRIIHAGADDEVFAGPGQRVTGRFARFCEDLA